MCIIRDIDVRRALTIVITSCKCEWKECSWWKYLYEQYLFHHNLFPIHVYNMLSQNLVKIFYQYLYLHLYSIELQDAIKCKRLCL